MNTAKDIQTAGMLINKDFQLENEERLPMDLNAMEELENALSQMVNYLLHKDFQRLVNAMYRIDISEYKFRAALEEGEAEMVARNIARLIIDRELQKVATRKKYS